MFPMISIFSVANNIPKKSFSLILLRRQKILRLVPSGSKLVKNGKIYGLVYTCFVLGSVNDTDGNDGFIK